MPGSSYSLPAAACRTGSRLACRDDAVCHNCYARKGRYTFKKVQAALRRRLESIEHPLWEEAMIQLIGSTKCRWFRWHDSGDLVSVNHLSNICSIADKLPEKRFWLPTREAATLLCFLREGGSVPGNLTIRYSCPLFDRADVPPALQNWPISSSGDPAAIRSLGLDVYVCPAVANPEKGKAKCGNCRACWSSRAKHVLYKKH